MVQPYFDALHEFMTTHVSKMRNAHSRITGTLLSDFVFVLV